MYIYIHIAAICNTDLKWHYICIKSLLSIIIVNEYVQIDYILIIYIKSLKANWCIFYYNCKEIQIIDENKKKQFYCNSIHKTIKTIQIKYKHSVR